MAGGNTCQSPGQAQGPCRLADSDLAVSSRLGCSFRPTLAARRRVRHHDTSMADIRFAGWPDNLESPSYFWQGGETLKVPMSLHLENREKVIRGFHAKGFKSGIAFVAGGETRYRNDTDHEELFRQESNFHYLFGVIEPDCFGALNMSTGKATLFIPKLPAGASYTFDATIVWLTTALICIYLFFFRICCLDG